MACDLCISTIFMILLKVSKPDSSINAPNEELKNDVDITGTIMGSGCAMRESVRVTL